MRTRRMCYELPPKRISPIASLRAVRSTTCKLERRTRTTRAGKNKVGRGMEGTSMCDLPADLVAQEILTRVPITSLKAVRYTCKLWDSLTKEWILGKAARPHQFFGFMTKDFKVCSVRFHLCRGNSKDNKDEDEENLHDLSVKQVDLLDQFKISNVFHCDGLLLCLAEDQSGLVMWNPYLGQTQWIGFTTCYTGDYCEEYYALGYDINRNHKILRFLNYGLGPALKRYEIYEFSSNSWRVLEVTSDWEMCGHGGTFLKGNAYFYAWEFSDEDENKDFLLRFDFTTEGFGPHLPFPVHKDFSSGNIVGLSCIKEEKLAVVVYEQKAAIDRCCDIIQIWVTTTIEPNYVSWSQFLRVEIKPFALTGFPFSLDCGSFFINEEEKVAMVFDFNGYHRKETRGVSYHTAFVIGEGGYIKSVSLGVADKAGFCTPLVCSSSYLPSLVQLNQPHKGKDRGV